MFFRKDAQKNFEHQIESLQQQVVALQKLLTAEQAQLLIQTGLFTQLQEDVAELESELQAERAATSAVNSKSAAVDALGAEVAGLKAQVSKLQAELEPERAKSAQALEQVKQLQAGQSQHKAAAKQLNEANLENELLLSKLMQVQEELEKIFLDKKQLEASAKKAGVDAKAQIEVQKNSTNQVETEVVKLNAALAAVDVELSKAKKELIQARQSLSAEQSANKAAEAALAEIKAKSATELKAVTAKYQQQAKQVETEVAKLNAALAAVNVELGKAKEELTKAQQSLSAEQSAKKAVEATLSDIKAKSVIELKALTEKYQQQAKASQALEAELAKNKVELEQLRQQVTRPLVDHSPKLKEAEQENELLLSQLMQVQEELESYYLDKTKFEKLYQDLQARWVRIEGRYPSFVDFGSLELVAFENLSDVPSITFRVKDYVQSGGVVSEFLFQTVLEEGQPGLGLAADANGTAIKSGTIVPKLLMPQSTQLERFLRIGHTEFRQIMAASAIVSQLEASGWRGVDLPKGLDLGFWRESLKVLPAQMQALPVLLRYDAVKLKRELINPDYEHLWLEFKSMSLGARTWPKFEMRLGAAMVQRVGFSQFPKFEFPLIDGKVKPFDSWYAESQDDHGGKLELRFSLEKNVFDTSVWSKLDDADKVLLLRLIYVTPAVLLRLEAEQAVIERPWATWVGFAKAATQVIEASRAAAAKLQQAPEPSAAPTALPAAASKPPRVLNVAKASGTKNVMPLDAIPAKAIAKPPAPAKKAVPTKKVSPVKAKPSS
jgi:hypothetical protein